ncbi:MarR family transcriptional regulator [Bailinhaonella thermotolerans]|uniref:MarR family transcriptional regulator n=1 Tax=Bailinhaonella thermotolerans TaxID=1070861 RepID=A0A3A4A7V9_9ACTN|nr:helix-turn-helix domain-containing protein [Bailinhaonella thermotolerans]RJL21086.1 MarR family transcriptional regulator [Bailinhaonella thermotolerans]
MSARLVGDVAIWLDTPAALGLTPAERLVLMIIAERANEQSRRMWRYRSDESTLHDLLARRVGVSSGQLTRILGRLSRRGLEVRVPLKYDRRGRPVYGRRGHACDFQLPELPTTVTLPPRANPCGQPGPDVPGGSR